MASRADLERLVDTLAQAAAILAYSGGPARRLTAVRTLLQAFGNEDMPTSAARDLWIEIAQSMLRLGGGAATSVELHGLDGQIGQLRDVIHAHLGHPAG